MALWKDGSGTPEKVGVGQDYPSKGADRPAASYEAPRRVAARADGKESIIAAGLTIEGKIEGSGHVRIAGSFNGDVQVDGDLTIEAGAKVTGAVKAHTVTIGGELKGNIEGASSVELLNTGILDGDLNAGSFTVAAGSRMRGRVEFGWEGTAGEKKASVPGGGIGVKKEAGSAA